MTYAKDFDGFIAHWNTLQMVPPNIAPFADFVYENLETNQVIELGSGSGALTAVLSRKLPEISFLALDKLRPIAAGRFEYKNVDGWSDEFFELLTEEVTLIARRTLCLFWSIEWMKKLTESKIQHILIESLDGDKHFFNSAEVEAAYLRVEGWDATVTGKFISVKRRKSESE